MEPLLLHAGWVTKRKSGLLSSAPRRMFARLTLGLSPAHPAQFSCYESEAPSAARIKHASCDSTVALKADPATLQLPVRTRPNAAHALSALQSLTTGGSSSGSGGSSAVELRAWSDAVADRASPDAMSLLETRRPPLSAPGSPWPKRSTRRRRRIGERKPRGSEHRRLRPCRGTSRRNHLRHRDRPRSDPRRLHLSQPKPSTQQLPAPPHPPLVPRHLRPSRGVRGEVDLLLLLLACATVEAPRGGAASSPATAAAAVAQAGAT